jgi:hypothetical protein
MASAREGVFAVILFVAVLWAIAFEYVFDTAVPGGVD